MKNIYKIILSTLLVFVVGFGVGYLVSFSKENSILNKDLKNLHPIRLNSSSYKFINPLLVNANVTANESTRFSGLKNKISDLINQEKSHGLNRASVFLSDLNQGEWIGVNEKEKYQPASMFKVVVMIAYFRGSEQVPGLLDKKLTYTKDIDNLLKNIPLDDQTSLQVGSSYTIDELVNKMIVDSDNGAKDLLMNQIDASFFKSLFSILGLPPFNSDTQLLLSPRQYSLFFRLIYNATFLDGDLSEKALGLLSKTTFNDGLVAGVPAGTVVSHKFGLYDTTKNNQITDIQLHDCGIVYYKTTPYFLCVMTDGNNLTELQNTIKNISSLVYKNYQSNQ